MSTETGGCLCDAVRFSAANVGHDHGACHCGMCRRWSAGPLMAMAVGGVDFEGEEHIRRYRSSEWAERGFCKVCGTNLFYHLLEADHYTLCVGTFDNAADFSLTSEIFIDNKPDGYEFAGDHPRLTAAETIAKYSSAAGN